MYGVAPTEALAGLVQWALRRFEIIGIVTEIGLMSLDARPFRARMLDEWPFNPMLATRVAQATAVYFGTYGAPPVVYEDVRSTAVCDKS